MTTKAVHLQFSLYERAFDMSSNAHECVFRLFPKTEVRVYITGKDCNCRFCYTIPENQRETIAK